MRGRSEARARVVGVAVVGLVMLLASSADALARERRRSGTYTGNRGNQGTFDRSVTRERGQRGTSTTWEGQRGQGSREESSTWDQSTGTGTRSATTTRPGGRTSSRDSTITKTGEGAYTVEGTRTGLGVETLTTDKSVQRTESGRSVTGTYESSAGERGAFAGSATHGEGTVTKTGAIVTDEGKTAERSVTTSLAEPGTVTRTVTTTDLEGETHTRTGTATVETPQ